MEYLTPKFTPCQSITETMKERDSSSAQRKGCLGTAVCSFLFRSSFFLADLVLFCFYYLLSLSQPYCIISSCLMCCLEMSSSLIQDARILRALQKLCMVFCLQSELNVRICPHVVRCFTLCLSAHISFLLPLIHTLIQENIKRSRSCPVLMPYSPTPSPPELDYRVSF